MVSEPESKRARLTFKVSSGFQARGRAETPRNRVAAGVFADPDDEPETLEQEAVVAQPASTPSMPIAMAASARAPVVTSSVTFERYRGSLRARNAPLFRHYTRLLGAERGFQVTALDTACAPDTLAALGLAELGAIVESLVQLADLRAEQQLQKTDAQHGMASVEACEASTSPVGTAVGACVPKMTPSDDLIVAARELFEALCSAVGTLPRALPGIAAISPDLYLDELRKVWKGPCIVDESSGITGSSFELGAARAAALLRMRDTVSSLYAWALLSQSVAAALIHEVRAVVSADRVGLSDEDVADDQTMFKRAPRVCVVDPIAATGLHAAILRTAGVDALALADYVEGGNSQSGSQLISHCAVSDAGTRRAAAFSDEGTNASVIWENVQKRNVLDDTASSLEWWEQFGCGGRSSADQDVHVLFLSYPPAPPSTVGEVCLQRFRGDWLLFIGEWRGCTGTAAFFDKLDKEWEQVRRMEIPRWPMMEDAAYVFRRRLVKQKFPTCALT